MIKELRDQVTPVYDRHENTEKRTKDEIGIHAVRGGTIVGEHDILFAGTDETITISHKAQSKDIFANGAIGAAEKLIHKEMDIILLIIYKSKQRRGLNYGTTFISSRDYSIYQ